jgi:hypothetical protein
MAWDPSIKSIYVMCNPEKEPERYKRIIPHLLSRGIPKDQIIISGTTWKDTLDLDIVGKVYNPFLQRGNIPSFSYKSACLSKGELSLNLNFYYAIRNAATTLAEKECILFLESDSYLRRDFKERLGHVMRDLSGQEWDYVSLGEGVGSRPTGHPTSYYGPMTLSPPNTQFVFRCTDSMLLSKRFIDKLCRTFIPFKECLDWELNFQMMLHEGVSLWADPPLAEPGSWYSRDPTHLS